MAQTSHVTLTSLFKGLDEDILPGAGWANTHREIALGKKEHSKYVVPSNSHGRERKWIDLVPADWGAKVTHSLSI